MREFIIIIGEENSGKTTFLFSKIRANIADKEYIYLAKDKYFNTLNKKIKFYSFYEKDLLKTIKHHQNKSLLLEINLNKDILNILNSIFTTYNNVQFKLFIVADKIANPGIVNTINEIYHMYKKFANIKLILNKVKNNELSLAFPLLKRDLLYPFVEELVSHTLNTDGLKFFIEPSLEYEELEYSEYLKPIALYKISLFDYIIIKNKSNSQDFLYEYFKKNFLKVCYGGKN